MTDGDNMKDVEKTSVKRNNSRKRTRRRGRWMNLYGLAVALIVLTVGITFCYTFLFNLNEIRVSGESDMYSAEEIVAAAGINKGDNLLRLDTDKSEKQILDKLLYVETASVKKKFPSSVEIKVTRCIPAYNVFHENGILLVSKKGKILASDSSTMAEPVSGLPSIYGYEPSVVTAGKMIETENDHKSEAFSELISCLASKGDVDIMSVDMTNEFAVTVNYKNGMVFRMGSWTDVEYKLSLAESVMQEDSIRGKKGYLTMVGTNQCSFRMTDKPVGNSGDSGTEDQLGEIAGNVTGEVNPDQEALFDEFGNYNGQSGTEIQQEQYGDEYSQNDIEGDQYYEDTMLYQE